MVAPVPVDNSSASAEGAERGDIVVSISLLDPDLPVAVAVADLDGFAPFNEAHGAAAGDAVLAAFERSLTEGLPAGALVAHVRGDEFAVALPDMSCEEALLALETIRADFGRAEPAPDNRTGSAPPSASPAWPTVSPPTNFSRPPTRHWSGRSESAATGSRSTSMSA